MCDVCVCVCDVCDVMCDMCDVCIVCGDVCGGRSDKMNSPLDNVLYCAQR